jgi:hypothetical protein
MFNLLAEAQREISTSCAAEFISIVPTCPPNTWLAFIDIVGKHNERQ